MGTTGEAAALRARKGRCRCGHRPTHHIQVHPIGDGGNFALRATGPCELCGEAVCRRFTPG